MNLKTLGDLAQNRTIGELSKYGLGIAFPLSDNYPFDLIAIANNKLYKVQVRGSSSSAAEGCNGEVINFHLAKTNFRTGARSVYEDGELDVFALFDFKREKLHLIKYVDLVGRSSISIRYNIPLKLNNGTNYATDTEISEKRVKEIFGIDPPLFYDYYSKREKPKFDHVCNVCGKSYTNGCRNSKYCGITCSAMNQRKVERPSKEQLQEDLKRLPVLHIGAKYGVSDNAVRKWASAYGI